MAEYRNEMHPSSYNKKIVKRYFRQWHLNVHYVFGQNRKRENQQFGIRSPIFFWFWLAPKRFLRISEPIELGLQIMFNRNSSKTLFNDVLPKNYCHNQLQIINMSDRKYVSIIFLQLQSQYNGRRNRFNRKTKNI